MPLTPEEIRAQQFRKSFRGFDAAEVGKFLDTVAGELEQAAKEKNELQEHVTGMESHLAEYRNIEKILQQTLLQAQETGSRAVENARKEAELMLQQTEVKASEMLNQARRDLTLIKEQITILLAKKEYIISRLKMLLASEMETVKSLEGDPDLTSAPQQPPRAATQGASEYDDILKHIE